jgi:hypothetical protein
MSERMKQLEKQLADLDQRIKEASNDHQAAKSVFGRYEGPAGSPVWNMVRNEVDRTLTHLRVLQAVWHRIKADILEQQNREHHNG